MTNEIETTPEENTTDDERNQVVAESVERAVGTLFGIGRLWASHGLGVGKSALETSAITLRTTADLLGDLSERFIPAFVDEVERDDVDEEAA